MKRKNPKRIAKILDEIRMIWVQHSELRLCQLIGNCFVENQSYYVEDEELIKKLKEKYNV